MREPRQGRPEAGRRGFVLRLAVSLALLVLLLLLVDRRALVARLSTADPALMLAVVGLATADRLLMAWKWWLLVHGRTAALGLWTAVRAYYVASFAGYFLPMTVGADAVRVGALAGRVRPAVLVASIVLERLIGALAQAVLTAVSLAALVALGLGVRIGPAERWGLAAVGALAFVGFLLSFPAARWLARRTGTVGGWRGALRALGEQYAGYGASTGLLSAFFALTLLEGAIPILIQYVSGRALGLNPGWTFYIATVPLVYMVARLPVSVGGLGFLELSFVSVAGFLGMRAADAFSIAGLATALYIVALIPGAVLYLLPAGPAVRPTARERMP